MTVPHNVQMLPQAQVVCRHRGGCLLPAVLMGIGLLGVLSVVGVGAVFLLAQRPVGAHGSATARRPVPAPTITPPVAETRAIDRGTEVRVRHGVRGLTVRTGPAGDQISWHATAALVDPAGRQVERADRGRIAAADPGADGITLRWTFVIPAGQAGPGWRLRITAKDEMTGGVATTEIPLSLK